MLNDIEIKNSTVYECECGCEKFIIGRNRITCSDCKTVYSVSGFPSPNNFIHNIGQIKIMPKVENAKKGFI